MKITPLDIRQKRFASAFRGFHSREVEGYLELLAAEFEEVVKENVALKEELKRTQARLEQHVERERTLQETMVTAQRISEDIKVQAKKEAEIHLADAEHQADKLLHNAQGRLGQVLDEIAELKRQKVRFEAQVRVVVESHLKLLEAFSTPQEDEPRGAVSNPFTPKVVKGAD
jgi:cell division initiation protein